MSWRCRLSAAAVVLIFVRHLSSHNLPFPTSNYLFIKPTYAFSTPFTCSAVTKSLRDGYIDEFFAEAEKLFIKIKSVGLIKDRRYHLQLYKFCFKVLVMEAPFVKYDPSFDTKIKLV